MPMVNCSKELYSYLKWYYSTLSEHVGNMCIWNSAHKWMDKEEEMKCMNEWMNAKCLIKISKDNQSEDI